MPMTADEGPHLDTLEECRRLGEFMEKHFSIPHWEYVVIYRSPDKWYIKRRDKE